MSKRGILLTPFFSVKAILCIVLGEVVWIKTLPRHCQGFSLFGLHHQPGEVLAVWLELTADWLVSLSDVTGPSALVYCEMSQPADGRRNCHHLVFFFFNWSFCHPVGASGDAVGRIWSQTTKTLLKIWAWIAQCFHIKNWSDQRHLH